MPTGTPVSGVLSFYFRDEVLPYYAGDTVAARDLAANDFKYWELMRRACERGLQGVRLRAQQAGHRLLRFQEELGLRADAAAYEYRLFTRDSIPQHNPLNPKYRALIALWRRLPRPLVNAIGPLAVRNLG